MKIAAIAVGAALLVGGIGGALAQTDSTQVPHSPSAPPTLGAGPPPLPPAQKQSLPPPPPTPAQRRPTVTPCTDANSSDSNSSCN